MFLKYSPFSTILILALKTPRNNAHFWRAYRKSFIKINHSMIHLEPIVLSSTKIFKSSKSHVIPSNWFLQSSFCIVARVTTVIYPLQCKCYSSDLWDLTITMREYCEEEMWVLGFLHHECFKILKSRVEDEWFQEFWSMSDVENQYSHFWSHSIHIVENCKSCKNRR